MLQELAHKYSVTMGEQVPLAARLDVLREHIRREIRKVSLYLITVSTLLWLL